MLASTILVTVVAIFGIRSFLALCIFVFTSFVTILAVLAVVPMVLVGSPVVFAALLPVPGAGMVFMSALTILGILSLLGIFVALGILVPCVVVWAAVVFGAGMVLVILDIFRIIIISTVLAIMVVCRAVVVRATVRSGAVLVPIFAFTVRILANILGILILTAQVIAVYWTVWMFGAVLVAGAVVMSGALVVSGLGIPGSVAAFATPLNATIAVFSAAFALILAVLALGASLGVMVPVVMLPVLRTGTKSRNLLSELRNSGLAVNAEHFLQQVHIAMGGDKFLALEKG
jgi:hypothetical protein